MPESNRGAPFTEKGFYNLVKDACRKAGLPHCSPHGLRKSASRRCREAGCTDEEGKAIAAQKGGARELPLRGKGRLCGCSKGH